MGAVAVGTGAHRSQPVHFGTVERRALRERLHAATTNRVTLVSAPAGFGKSALLQELRSAHPETVRLLPTMTPPPECACPEGTVLVIDEREPLARPFATSDLVEFLEVLGPEVHVVASRRQPWSDDDVQQLGRDPIARFTSGDLTFTEYEAELLVRRGLGGMTSADTHPLWERTGGWAAGLSSALIAMRDVEDVLTYVEVLGGDDRHVAAYLRAEVISQLDTDELDFLARTSVNDRLDARLCAWVTTDDTAPQRLAALHQKGIIETHGNGATYSCHPLLRDHLWRTLKEEDYATARTCATRAAEWHTIRGELDVAMRLYIKGDAWSALLQMIDRAAPHLVAAGQERAVADALSQVPSSVRGRRRSNLIDYAAFQTWGGDRQSAEDTLVRLTDQPAEPSEATSINVLHASRVRLHGRGASAANAADAAIAAIEAGVLGPRRLAGVPAPDLDAYTRTLRATARWYEGDISGARADFEASSAHGTRILPWRVRAEGGLALLEASVGQLRRADILGREALARAEAASLQHHQCTVDALLAISMVERERNQVHAAIEGLERAQELARASHEAVPLAMAMIERARCDLAMRDLHSGIETLAESRRALAAVQSSRFTRLADAVEAQLMFASGRGERALKLLTADGPMDDNDVRANTVRAFLEHRLLDDAIRCLKDWAPTSELRPMLQRRMWSAVVDHVRGSRRSAALAFAEVAADAEVEGFVRLFVDAGPLVTRLLNDTLALRPTAYLEGVAQESAITTAQAAPQSGAPTADIIALLSQRELEVVRYLPTRLSAIEIAEHLYISYNTLKSHMRSIYRKFDVSSRQELIIRAEELDLA